MTDKQTQIKGIIIDSLAMLFVTALSVFVLLYVAFGAARQSYQQFLIEKLIAQGQIVQSAMEAYLRPGLPIQQFTGFKQLSETMVDSSSGTTDISAYDTNNKLVFTNGDSAIDLIQKSVTTVPLLEGRAELRQDILNYQVVLPLRNRFETVGSLSLVMPIKLVDERVNDSLRWLIAFSGVVCVCLSCLIILLAPRHSGDRVRWMNVAFGIAFLTITAAVVVSLVSLYAEGSQAKGKALANSLGQRLEDVVAYQLNFDEIEGLGAVFSDYRRLNPEIQAIGLTVDGRILVHTDEAQLGRNWQVDSHTFEYVNELSKTGSARQTLLILSVPKTVVYAQVMRSVKNFAALFIASVFFATLFLQITRALRERARNYLENFDPTKQQVPVALVKPLFFLAVFAEHLSYAFLPQYMRGIALSEAWGASWIAAPFMAFYFCFAMALIPSGRYETRIGSKPLICYGLLLAVMGVGLMPFIHSLHGMIVLRAIAGIGQGMLFIGVQSYILNSTTADHRTRGASVIVFGFQAGMVSGLAIGSLLVGQIGEKGVFMLSASAMVIALIYTVLIIPAATARPTMQSQPDGAGDAWHMMRMIINDWPFLKTMVLIGVPAKGIMTGVVLFAFPLLLSQLGYGKEDIGQLTMLYAIGVLLTSGFASRLVDRSGNTVAVLVIGSFMCAVGLMMFAMLGFAPVRQTFGTGWGQVLLIVSAIVLIGFSHGFINAPVVTHIASLELSERLGQSSVAATYRFLERLGHFGGPLFVGWMLTMHHDSPSVFAWLSIMILVFGLIFLATANPPRKNLMREEYA